MNKFWEWMNNVNRGVISFGVADRIYLELSEKQFTDEIAYIEVDCCERLLDKRLPENILIGYMLEYIRDHEIWESEKFPYLDGDLVGIEMRLSMVWNHVDQYNELKQIIELIDGEE